MLTSLLSICLLSPCGDALGPLIPVAAAQAAATVPAAAVIDPERLSRHTRILASDEFTGRGPGTPGEDKTVAYIIEQFKAAGAGPGGESGSWTQAVQMNRFSLASPPALHVQGSRPGCRFALRGDEVVLWTKRLAARVDIRSAPLVFLGYGVDAPQQHWNDYAGMDLRGKIAVVLANDPDHEAASGPFEGPAMTYFGRPSYKAEEASRKGALAVLIINHPKSSGYSWNVVQSLFATPAMDIPRPGEARVAFEGWLKLEAADKLLACAGLELTTLRQAAASATFRAVPLAGLSLTTRFPVQVTPLTTHNVLGIVRGTERPLQTFLYTAHWDHLGRGKPDSTGDDIYNGALDNAVGVAGLLELARAFAAAPRTRRSVVFIATTLEESGLLGAEYYATHPIYPLDQTAGGINMDAVNVFGPTQTMEVTGLGKTDLEDLLGQALQQTGRQLRQDPNSLVGFYYRSDHFPFARRGVPFLFAGSGWELADSKLPNRRDPQLGTRFHQPADEWSKDLDFAAAARDLRVYYAVGQKVADSARWPAWKPDAEFRQLRDASSPARQ